jgi:hypothetical protein
MKEVDCFVEETPLNHNRAQGFPLFWTIQTYKTNKKSDNDFFLDKTVSKLIAQNKKTTLITTI